MRYTEVRCLPGRGQRTEGTKAVASCQLLGIAEHTRVLQAESRLAPVCAAKLQPTVATVVCCRLPFTPLKGGSGLPLETVVLKPAWNAGDIDFTLSTRNYFLGLRKYIIVYLTVPR